VFTGLVQGVGEVIAIAKAQDSALITFASDLAADLAVGDSVSINGVCLTATEVKENSFTADSYGANFEVDHSRKFSFGIQGQHRVSHQSRR